MTTDREKIQEVIGKTEDHFEEKLTYISAGTLGLTLTFIENIVPIGDSVSVIFLVLGWGFLVMTLLLNLSSHMISKHYLIKTQLELDKNSDTKFLNSIYLKVIKRNKRIDCINWITVGLLILGISFIIAFASLNSFQKASKMDNINQLNKSAEQATDSISSNNKIINYFIMAINNNSTSNQGKELLNEGRTIPNLTPQKEYFEKGLTIPLPNNAQSQESKPEPQPPKTSEK